MCIRNIGLSHTSLLMVLLPSLGHLRLLPLPGLPPYMLLIKATFLPPSLPEAPRLDLCLNHYQ